MEKQFLSILKEVFDDDGVGEIGLVAIDNCGLGVVDAPSWFVGFLQMCLNDQDGDIDLAACDINLYFFRLLLREE